MSRVAKSFKLDPEFAKSFDAKAAASGAYPAQRLVALDRMTERLDLEHEVAADLAQLQAEARLAQTEGRAEGGRACARVRRGTDGTNQVTSPTPSK